MTRLQKENMKPKFSEVTELWDNPVEATDCLSRTAFACHIANALQNWKKEESLIVGLFGQWGSGKTWLLHRIRAEVAKNNTFTVCNFSPWQYESNEQITSEFFNAVFDTLPQGGDSKHEKRAKLWASLGAMVSVAQIGAAATSLINPAIAAASPVLGGINQLLKRGEKAAIKSSTLTRLRSVLTGKRSDGQTNTVSEVRKELFDLFSNKDAPKILVTIDDLDRLHDDQIQMIFRLIKTTVNFPNLHFLILGERHQLSKALDPIAHNEGDRYMEKIVQIPIFMPEAESFSLKTRLEEGLTIIAEAYGYENGRNEFIGRHDDFWNDFLKIKLTNLRSIHRLLTVLEFKCSALTDKGKLEVDLLDLLAVEYLRLFSPTTYGKVLEQLPRLTNGFRKLGASSTNEQKDLPQALALLENSELGAKGAYHICSHLFPKFSGFVEDWSIHNLDYSERRGKITLLSSERPVCNPIYQAMYFKFSLDNTILNRSTYDLILNESDVGELKQRLLNLEPKIRLILFHEIESNEKLKETITRKENWLFALSDISDNLDDTNAQFHTSESQYAYNIWLNLFSEIPFGNPQIELINSLFQKTNAVTLAALLLEDLRDRADLRYSEHKVNIKQELPELSSDQLDAFSDQLQELARFSLIAKTYRISCWAGRLYRLLYSIGTKRFEALLRDGEAIGDEDVIAIVESIAHSTHYRYSDSLTSPASLVESNISLSFFQELQKFASKDFWTNWMSVKQDNIKITEAQSVLLEHIRLGAEKIKEAPSGSEDIP